MSKSSDKKEQSMICSFWASMRNKEKRIYDKDPFLPFCECRREEKQGILFVHLQGFDKKDLEVETHGQNLVIKGEKQDINSHKWQKCRKEFKIRDDWDVTNISADLLRAGVLRITIPKKKLLPANLRKSFSRLSSKMMKSFSKMEASYCGVTKLVLLLLFAFQTYVILKICSPLKAAN